jgi:hypothetical protein
VLLLLLLLLLTWLPLRLTKQPPLLHRSLRTTLLLLLPWLPLLLPLLRLLLLPACLPKQPLLPMPLLL